MKRNMVLKKSILYTIKKGDTLWDLSEKYLGDPWEFPRIWCSNLNKIKDPDLIYVGQTIVIPATLDNNPSATRISTNRQPPKSLKQQAHKIRIPFSIHKKFSKKETIHYLNFDAHIKLDGKVVLKKSQTVPLASVTAQGGEVVKKQALDAIDKLTREIKVDQNGEKVTFSTYMVLKSNEQSGHSPSVAIGPKWEAGKPMPSFTVEFRFPSLNGKIDSFDYSGSLKAIIEIEPKIKPPISRREKTPFPKPSISKEAVKTGKKVGTQITIGVILTWLLFRLNPQLQASTIMMNPGIMNQSIYPGIYPNASMQRIY